MKKWYEETHLLTKRKEDSSHLSTGSENNIAGEVRPSCSWCGHSGFSGSGVQGQIQGRSSTLALFCSEVCFSQCRRAAFKQTRMCDWCKHVGHSLTVTDFFEGERQLQFCGHKCVNQYKMHLFCKEASSLGIAPQTSDIKVATSVPSLPKEALITPESWLGETCSSKPSPAIAEDSESLQSTDNELPSSPLDLVNYSKKTRSKRVKVKSDPVSPLAKKGKGDTPNTAKGKATPRTTTPSTGFHSAGPSQVTTTASPDQVSACGQNLLWQQGLMPFPFRPPFLDPSAFLPPWVNLHSPLLGLPTHSPVSESNDTEQESSLPARSRRQETGENPSRMAECLDTQCDTKAKESCVCKDEAKTVNSSTSVFAPHYVFTPYPVLVPLPIPVPIIVPSKHLESIKNSMEYKAEEPE